MNLGELETRCRNTTQDTAAKKLWSRDEFAEYLNEAATEIAIRSLCIEDDTIEIAATAGEAKVACPEHVYRIQRATFGTRRLLLADRAMLDQLEGEGWEELTGDPIAIYEVGGDLRLYPIPTVDSTVKLVAFCTPQQAMAEDDDDPQGIPVRMHPYLIDWALHLAYSKQDADTFDTKQADRYEGRFDARFGPRRDERAGRPSRINVRRRAQGHYF